MSENLIKEYAGKLYKTVPEPVPSSCEGCVWDETSETEPCMSFQCGNSRETQGIIWVPYKQQATALELENALKGILAYFESGNSIKVSQATIKADSPEILKARQLVNCSI